MLTVPGGRSSLRTLDSGPVDEDCRRKEPRYDHPPIIILAGCFYNTLTLHDYLSFPKLSVGSPREWVRVRVISGLSLCPSPTNGINGEETSSGGQTEVEDKTEGEDGRKGRGGG